MKKKFLLPGAVLLALAVLLVVLHVTREQSPHSALKLYGNVDIREATLAFRVGGKVKALYKDEGEAVESGGLLAELDPVPYEERLRQAEAEVALQQANLELLKAGYRKEEIEQARAQLSEARAGLELAGKNLERQRHLDATQAGRGQELDLAVARKEQAEAALESARARVRLLEAGFRPEEIAQAQARVRLAAARLEEARTALADARLSAPSAGTVRTRVVEEGAIVAAGSPVFVLSLQENPWVRAYIPEARLGGIRPGMRVEVHTDSRPGKPYTGRIGFISPTAEFTPKSVHTEELRTNLVFRFRVIVEDADEALRQGMPVTVSIPAATRPAGED